MCIMTTNAQLVVIMLPSMRFSPFSSTRNNHMGPRSEPEALDVVMSRNIRAAPGHYVSSRSPLPFLSFAVDNCGLTTIRTNRRRPLTWDRRDRAPRTRPARKERRRTSFRWNEGRHGYRRPRLKYFEVSMEHRQSGRFGIRWRLRRLGALAEAEGSGLVQTRIELPILNASTCADEKSADHDG
jgi:hypothetical protein